MKKIGLALVIIIAFSSCKKDRVDTEPDDPLSEIAALYEKAGFTFLGRFDTFMPDVPGSYFITPLDVRKINGTLYASWQIEQQFYSSFDVFSGSLKDKKFVKSNYEACGNQETDSDFRRVLNHEFDGQGNLFTSYRYRESSSMNPTWFHSFCCSSGLASLDEFRDYQMKIAENNQIVTAVGAQSLYNGYEYPFLKYHTYGFSSWTSSAIEGLKPKIQNYDYYVSENGNAYIAYTDAQSGDNVDGSMNLIGSNGAGWVNLGSIPLPAVRKLIVNFFEPYQIRIIRNGDNPFIVLFRENNTIAVFKFDGVALQLLADDVPYPFNPTQSFTVTTKTDLCVHNSKLTTFGFGNSLGLLNDPHSVYQLNGSAFTVYKTVGAGNITLRGVYSDNTSLWAACEVFRADNGVFRSPVDIIEIK